MKRWFLFAAVTVVLPVIALACGGDDNPGTTSGVTPTSTIDGGKPNPTTTTTTTSPTSTADAGDASTKRTGCLDRPTNVERPDRLPCSLIPPGLTL